MGVTDVLEVVNDEYRFDEGVPHLTRRLYAVFVMDKCRIHSVKALAWLMGATPREVEDSLAWLVGEELIMSRRDRRNRRQYCHVLPQLLANGAVFKARTNDGH